MHTHIATFTLFSQLKVPPPRGYFRPNCEPEFSHLHTRNICCDWIFDPNKRKPIFPGRPIYKLRKCTQLHLQFLRQSRHSCGIYFRQHCSRSTQLLAVCDRFQSDWRYSAVSLAKGLEEDARVCPGFGISGAMLLRGREDGCQDYCWWASSHRCGTVSFLPQVHKCDCSVDAELLGSHPMKRYHASSQLKPSPTSIRH